MAASFELKLNMSLPVAQAAVSSVHSTENLLFLVLLQLTVIVLSGRLGGSWAIRLGQTAAVGEIAIGLLLGPSLFGWLAPDTFHFVFNPVSSQAMQVLSQLGLIFLMFQIGMEFDFSHLNSTDNKKTVARVAAFSLIAPFALGFIVGYCSAPILSPHIPALVSGLFMGTAFSITALPVLGRILIEFNITQHPLGVIAISAAAINDVVGWLLLALVTTVAQSQFDAGKFAINVLLVLLFVVFCWLLLRPVLKALIQRMQTKQALSNSLMAVMLAIIFVAAITTYQLGIFAIFGAFIIGVLVHDEPVLVTAWRERLGNFVNVFFLPIFFTYTGLRTDIAGLNTLDLWLWCGLIVSLATLGKFLATYILSRYSKLSHESGMILGVLMNTRGLMELIVINVGYDLGVISRNVFSMLVIMALVSTFMTAPVLRHYLSRLSRI
jgi:Kef-type K+ transport system membrane component KefB